MKNIRGTASAVVPAGARESIELLACVEEYPRWHGDVVRQVTVLERDDQRQPTRAHAKLRVSRGPLRGDLDLTLAVELEPPATIKLVRIAHGADDGEQFEAVWSVSGGPQTRIGLKIEACLDIPRLVPIGGLGQELTEGFVAAAVVALGAMRA